MIKTNLFKKSLYILDILRLEKLGLSTFIFELLLILEDY